MDFAALSLPIPLALAVVATLGYLVGRRSRAIADEAILRRSLRDTRRAERIADELDRITKTVRTSLLQHRDRVGRFKQRVGKLNAVQRELAWQQLCREAEEMLRPTLHLAAQMGHACEEIRQQTAALMAFTEVRTDPLTGVSNRRGLDDSLDAQIALLQRYGVCFSLAIVDVDFFKRVNDGQGHLEGDRILKELALLLDDCARETDHVARYGGEEFVIVMPHTNLAGGAVFAERVRQRVERELPVTVSVGVAAAGADDTAESLLDRADQALYAAKSAGRNRVYRHLGEAGAPEAQVLEEVTL